MTHLEVIQKVWPDWKVTEKIGEGSFGQVFKAEKESYGIKQESAIKVVRIPSDEAELEKVRSSFGLNDDELKDYFYPQLDKLKKEIELMMKLDDSHIVKIHDFEIKESFDSKIGWHMLIRMELLECLEKYVRRKDIITADVVAIGEDILSCLETCEENNIIHRDIKPANLFRSDKGVYKLGDFGIAKDMSTDIGSLSFKGTENYMAPEVFMGRQYNDTIDIYALGIVLYKLLNKNRLPFMSQEKLTSESIEKAFQKRNTGETLPKPQQSPDAMYEVIKKMCAYKPEERFQTAAEAKKALTEYKKEAGDELKTLLDINNRSRNSFDMQSGYEEPEKSFVKPEYLMQDVLKKEVREDIRTEFAEFDVEDSDLKSLRKEESIQSIIFDEPYNTATADEKYSDKTRSLYQEDNKTIIREIEHPNISKIINEKENTVKKKKSKVLPNICIAALSVAVGVSLLFLIFGSNSSSKSKSAREIYDNDSMFAIDEEEYKGKFIEHTTSLLSGGELVERTGIYIGETKSGEPNGYGAFYYRREGKDDDSSFVSDNILIGTWKEGELTGSEEQVKRRNHLEKKYNNGDTLKSDIILKGDWDNGDFRGNPEGTSSSTYKSKESKETTTNEYEGTYEVTDNAYYRVKGDWYYNGYLYFSGEFKDDELYNGTLYDEDGKKIGKIIDGVEQDQ